MKKLNYLFFTGLLSFSLAFPSIAQEDSTATMAPMGDDLFDIDLEDLMNIEVTSVSKKAERLQDVASSIYVVTQDDIKKSGATNLHEVLRTVPGYWGTQDEYSNALSTMRNSPTDNGSYGTVLYLLDGTPIQDLMASTFSFKNFDIPLDEIDRIEVIRGSGGTVYGANSATGVVNIFTKSPEDYDGINVKAEGAAPGYGAVSVRAGGEVAKNLSVSGYGKYRYFSGFESLAGKYEDGTSTGKETRFTEDYEKSNMVSFGAKVNYNLSDKSKISLNTHYNSLSTIDYTNTYESDYAISHNDVLFKNNISSNRLVANLRYDLTLNDNHSLFVRASTNSENDFIKYGGGYDISNSIYDFEIQDNISLGSMNDFSLGLNYRAVNYDVNSFNSSSSINYIDAKNSESLKGAFIQDKVKLFDEMLNITLGIKAENFSLINDDYYLSPMAKVSFIPIKSLTLWGGFTQSYTTPGYNNTNVDLYIFQAPTPELLQGAIQPLVEQEVYQQVYDPTFAGALAATGDSATAAGIADNDANAYLESDAGKATVKSETDKEVANQVEENPSYAVKNGSKTVPTKFQTFEIGLRANIENVISLESNFYITNITDGISVGPEGTQTYQTSPTDPNRQAQYYLYGNYVKGKTRGTETMIKIRSTDGMMFEIAHSWTESSWELQENDDFDIHDESIIDKDDIDQTPSTPYTPQHVFRLKGYFDLPYKFNFSLGLIYATKYNSQSSYVYNDERYKNVADVEFDPINNPSSTIASNNSRTIINLRLEKALLDDDLTIYLFGNDIFNQGLIARTARVSNATLSQIQGMYGLGANYKF